MVVLKDFIIFRGLVFILFEDLTSYVSLFDNSPADALELLNKFIIISHGKKILENCYIISYSELKEKMKGYSATNSYRIRNKSLAVLDFILSL